MKKYLYFVIPVIILLIMVLSFIWLYPNKKDESSPSMNEVVNQIPDINDESINVIESDIGSPDVLENKEASEITEESEPEKVDEVIPKETTSKSTSPSPSSNTTTSSKTTSTSKKETSKESVKKEESNVTVKVEEKKEETKPTSTPNTEQATPKQDSTTSTDNKSEEIKKEETVVRCTNSNNHGMSVGNTGKWFSSKDEAIAYYKSQVKYWGDWWEGTSVDDTEADATYKKNCPSGYEVWSCMYCSKWTINFYYR